jgi:hypothetical protein
MKHRRLVVGLWDVAAQPDGDLVLAGDALGYAIGEDEPEHGFMIAARVRG